MIVSLGLSLIIQMPFLLSFLVTLLIVTLYNVYYYVIIKRLLLHFTNDEVQRRMQIKFDYLMKFQLSSFIFYLISLFSSSFIEEEHQIWYFVELTQVILIIVDYVRLLSNKQKENNLHKMSFYLTTTLCVIRLLRSMNQTGNKWINQVDIGDILKE